MLGRMEMEMDMDMHTYIELEITIEIARGEREREVGGKNWVLARSTRSLITKPGEQHVFS